MKFQRQSLAQSAPRQASNNAPVPSRPVNVNRLNGANAAENRDNRMSAHTAPWSRQQQGQSISPAVCWKCGQPGHVKRNCQSPASRPVTELRGAVNRGSRGLDHANVYLCMTLAGKVLPILVDSGCEVTLMPKTVVDAAGNIEVLLSSERLWAANGSEIYITGKATVPLFLHHDNCPYFAGCRRGDDRIGLAPGS